MRSKSGIRPVEYNLVVLPREVENTTAGGLIKPKTTVEREQWAQTKGVVVDIAAKAFDEWPGDRPDIGDTVVYSRHAGKMVDGVDGVTYTVIKDKDVVAVMEGAK